MKCKVCVITFLIVISDPYKGIDYSKPNTYTLTKECEKNCIIEVIEPKKEADNTEDNDESIGSEINKSEHYYFPHYLFL